MFLQGEIRSRAGAAYCERGTARFEIGVRPTFSGPMIHSYHVRIPPFKDPIDMQWMAREIEQDKLNLERAKSFAVKSRLAA